MRLNSNQGRRGSQTPRGLPSTHQGKFRGPPTDTVLAPPVGHRKSGGSRLRENELPFAWSTGLPEGQSIHQPRPRPAQCLEWVENGQLSTKPRPKGDTYGNLRRGSKLDRRLMFQYRVTKYDPALRTPDGTFSQPTWTSSADIGRSFLGQILTRESYLATETLYVAAVEKALSAATPSGLRLVAPEIWDTAQPSNLPKLALPEFIHARLLHPQEALTLARAILREILWGRIEGSNRFYVHFGYDYYMYIGGANDALSHFTAEGLFVEDHPSPYALPAGLTS